MYEFYVHSVIGVETELIFVSSFLVSAEKKCSWHSFNAVSHLPVVRSASIMLLLFAHVSAYGCVLPLSFILMNSQHKLDLLTPSA